MKGGEIELSCINEIDDRRFKELLVTAVFRPPVVPAVDL